MVALYTTGMYMYAQVGMEDGSRWTPLHRVAALRGNAKVAKALIDAGADVNGRDSSQTTVLMVGNCKYGNISGCDWVEGLYCYVLLQQAALNGHKDLVRLLLKSGANPQDKNQVRGQPCCMEAVVLEYCSVFSSLMQYGKTAVDFAKAFARQVNLHYALQYCVSIMCGID